MLDVYQENVHNGVETNVLHAASRAQTWYL